MRAWLGAIVAVALGSLVVVPGGAKAAGVTPRIAPGGTCSSIDLSLSASAVVEPSDTTERISPAAVPAVQVGDVLAVTLVLANAGPEAATAVTVTTDLVGLALLDTTPSVGTYDDAAGEWEIASLAAGATASLVARVQVLDGGDVSFSAAVTAATEVDADSVPGPPSGEDDEVTLTYVAPLLPADVSVVTFVSNATPDVGDTITVTVSATNFGAGRAPNTIVMVVLPSALVPSDISDGGVFDSVTSTITFSLGELVSGATRDLTFDVLVEPEVQLENVALDASITTDAPDPNLANNAATVSLDPQDADLSITKTVDAGGAIVGTNVTFTVVVTNTGNDTAVGTTVADLLPAGLAFVSGSTSAGTYDGATGTWSVGPLIPAASATLTLVTTLTASGELVNTAIVSSSTFDPDLTDNTASASTIGSILALRRAASTRARPTVSVPACVSTTTSTTTTPTTMTITDPTTTTSTVPGAVPPAATSTTTPAAGAPIGRLPATGGGRATLPFAAATIAAGCVLVVLSRRRSGSTPG